MSEFDEAKEEPLSTREIDALFKKNGKALFRRRMGKKWKQISARIKEIAAANGIGGKGAPYVKAYSQAIKEFGYLGAVHEKALLRIEFDGKQEKNRKEYVTGREQSFEGAVASLPKNAPHKEELDWIRAHPAMVRLARSKDKCGHITILAKDILEATHGVAPSQSAVYALQHWCNRPEEFFKAMLAEQKKEKGDSAGASSKQAESEEDLSEVERLLNQVKGAKA